MREHFAGNIPLNFSGPLSISLGGTSNETAPTAINALVPEQFENETKFLTTNGVYVYWDIVTGTVAPAGLNKQIQFNDNGEMGGSTALFDKLTDELVLSGDLLPSGTVNIGTSVNNFGNLYLDGLMSFRAIAAKVVDLGNTGTAIIRPDIEIGMILKYTVTGDITINELTNAVAGTSVTLILTQDSIGGHILTSTMLFAHGIKTLSVTPGAIDVISIVYDGAVYMASLLTNYS